MSVELTVTGRYTAKDQKKANRANCYIGFGRPGSSTARYTEDFGNLANKESYTKDDRVFVSSNGGYTNQILEGQRNVLVERACKAHAVIIADTPFDRMRSYNSGERTLIKVLTHMGYRETYECPDCSVWRHISDNRRDMAKW